MTTAGASRQPSRSNFRVVCSHHAHAALAGDFALSLRIERHGNTRSGNRPIFFHYGIMRPSASKRRCVPAG
jgi:hypothetical protein